MFKIIGEGALSFHVTAVWPVWYELSLKRDETYPLSWNIIVIVMLVSLPYLVCLLLSHRLYRHTHTKAPVIACVFSLVMFLGTLHFCNAAYDPNAGCKSIIFLPIIILQHLIGMISFAVLRSHFRRKLLKER